MLSNNRKSQGTAFIKCSNFTKIYNKSLEYFSCFCLPYILVYYRLQIVGIDLMHICFINRICRVGKSINIRFILDAIANKRGLIIQQ